MAHSFNPSTWEAEASLVYTSETLPQKINISDIRVLHTTFAKHLRVQQKNALQPFVKSGNNLKAMRIQLKKQFTLPFLKDDNTKHFKGNSTL